MDLAERSGVAQATLSRIENGVMKGTVESHRLIAEALGISLAELYSDVDSRLSDITHLEKKSRQSVSKKQNHTTYEVLTHQGSQKKLLPVLITLDHGGETDRERTDRGVDKFLWVLEGKIEVHLEKNCFKATKGDTLYFDASIPHTIKHISGTPARILTVTSPAAL